MKLTPAEESILQLYKKRGWRIFPVNKDKRPVIKSWKENASTDYTAFNGSTTGRWAIACGRGMFVVDVDAKHGATIDDVAKLGLPTDTLTIKTPSGGWHLYYNAEATSNIKNLNNGELGTGIDIRSDGGYVVAPPSDGYKITKNVDILELPMSVVTSVFPQRHSHNLSKTKKPNQKQDIGDDELIHEGQRNNILFQRGCTLRRLGAGEQEISMYLEGLNDNHCESPISQRDLKATIGSIMKYQPDDIDELTKAIYHPEAHINQPTDNPASFVKKASEVLSKEKLMKTNLKWIYKKMIPRGHPIMIFGRGGVGKTRATLAIIRKMKDVKVLWIPADSSPEDTMEVVNDMGIDSKIDFLLDEHNGTSSFDFSETSTRNMVLQTVKDGGYNLVVVDALTPFAGVKDTNTSFMAKLMADYNQPITNEGAAIIWLHHENKTGDFSGSVQIEAQVRRVFRATLQTNGIEKVLLKTGPGHGKDNLAGKKGRCGSITVSLSEENNWEITEEKSADEPSAQNQIHDAVVEIFSNAAEEVPNHEMREFFQSKGFQWDGNARNVLAYRTPGVSSYQKEENKGSKRFHWTYDPQSEIGKEITKVKYGNNASLQGNSLILED